ncbi:MAG TPA: DUF1223 domain-containing protein [Methylotenera sp.]|nr:DUF1223 domain-containing protein [Methylotenera sp.]HPV44233.1 DUF1223 domain-containing protein [Methylotenera sp.]
MKKLLAVIVMSTLGMNESAIAAECSAKSGAQTVPLLELYTSEGCSSCPPADKWLSGLKHNSNQVIPLAFHVDYWDYIGWKDRFAKAEYSERQRKTAAFAGSGYVYTPQLVFNGRDFKSWDNSRLNQRIEATQKLASRASLSLDAVTQASGEITLKASAQAVKPADAKNADVFVAIYENKLASQVNTGENSGRELKHDYVVREFFGAYQINNQNEFRKNFTLSPEWKNRGYKLENLGAVIFVQNSQTGEILQSLALKFCNS